MWNVSGAASPGTGDQFSTNAWVYTADTIYNRNKNFDGAVHNDGSLMGPILVTNPKFLAVDTDGNLADEYFSVNAGNETMLLPCDVDQEIFLYLTEIDESKSRYAWMCVVSGYCGLQ